MVTAKIDPHGATPVYRQVARIMAARISAGALVANRPIPSELQMGQEFGIAKGTARKAVQVLRDENLVTTIPGRGTFVNPVE